MKVIQLNKDKEGKVEGTGTRTKKRVKMVWYELMDEDGKEGVQIQIWEVGWYVYRMKKSLNELHNVAFKTTQVELSIDNQSNRTCPKKY